MEPTVRTHRPPAKWLAAATATLLLLSLLPFAGVALAATPTVSSINRAGSTPTNAASVSWTVTFSEAVVGVDSTDFALVTVGLGGSPAITGVSGSATSWTVTASTGSGDGTLGLNLVDNDSITSVSTSDPLGGTGAGNGNFTGQVYTIDRTVPTVTNVTSPHADGTFTVGESIPITVTFTESVTVTGTPTLALATGSPASTAVAYTGGSGTAILTFTYVVALNNFSLDLDYASTGALALNGGTINDLAGNVANRTLASPGAAGSLGANKAIVIQDTTPPTVSSINRVGGASNPTNGTSVSWTVTFSENVSGVGSGDFALAASGVSGASISSVSGSGTTYTVIALVPAGSGSGTLGLNLVDDDSIVDAALNKLGGTGAGNGNFTGQLFNIDRAGPTVTINQASGQTDPAGASPVNFTVVFTQSVFDFATGDVTLSGTAGATTATVTGSGTTYNVAVSGMTSSGTIIASIAADLAHSTVGSHPNAASTSSDNTVTFVLGSRLVFTAYPTYATSNVAFPTQPVVAIQDALGTTATTAPATVVTLAIGTNPTAGTLTCTGGLTATTVNGVATFSGCSINNAGVGYTLTATASGLTSATSTAFTVTAPAAVLTLTASPTMVNQGGSTTLTIQFASSGGYRSVTLQKKTALDAGWVTVGTFTADYYGRVTQPVTPTSTTAYQAYYAGASDLLAATSPARTVGVRYKATLAPKTSTGSSTVARGTVRTYVGTANPITAGQTVSLVIYKRIGSAWVYQTSATRRADSLGRVTLTWRWSKPGYWYIRVRANGNSMYSTAWGNYEKVTVR